MTNPDKQIEEILNELFDEGKRYGEDIGYAKDEALYEIRSSAISEAKQALTTIASQAREEEREKGWREAERLVDEIRDFAQDTGIKEVVEYIDLMKGTDTKTLTPKE